MSAPQSRPAEPLPALKPFYAQTKFILGLLIVGMVYVAGWRITEINPGALWRDAHLVKPLVTALLQPDLITQETRSEIHEARFQGKAEMGFEFSPPVQKTGPLTLSPHTGKVGDLLEVTGQGLKPNAEGRLIWVNAIDQEYPLGEVKTDASGNLKTTIKVPPIARGEAQQVRLEIRWPVGGWGPSRTLKLTLEKMIETVFLGLMATTMAVLVAAPLSFLGARNMMRSPLAQGIYVVVRVVFNLLRSVEPLIMAILFAVWVGIGPFAGVLALAVHATAALGKLFSEQIESIDPGPVEAITATGATPVQVMLYGVVPQVVPQFLALTFYRWDINVRMSTVIGFVGGGGVGFLLQQWINLMQYRQAATALWAIALVIIALDVVSARIREKITTV